MPRIAQTIKIISILSLLCLMSGANDVVMADVHRYQDHEGTIHLTNHSSKAKRSGKGQGPSTKAEVNIILRGSSESQKSSSHNSKNSHLSSDTPSLRTDCSKAVGGFDQLIEVVSTSVGVDASLLKALIKVESNFNPYALSAKGAQGLMQLMPKTARRHDVKNPYDPEQNILAGAQYLSTLMAQYNQNLDLALSAYNAGTQAVSKYQSIPPFKETQHFVQSVKAYQACFDQAPSSEREQ